MTDSMSKANDHELGEIPAGKVIITPFGDVIRMCLTTDLIIGSQRLVVSIHAGEHKWMSLSSKDFYWPKWEDRIFETFCAEMGITKEYKDE